MQSPLGKGMPVNGHTPGATTEPDRWLSESAHVRSADGRRRIAPAPSPVSTVFLSSAPTPRVSYSPLAIGVLVVAFLAVLTYIVAGGK